MTNSFRFRITAWYLAFFSALFVLFGVFLYGVLSRALAARLQESLTIEADTTANVFLDEIDEMKGDIHKAATEAITTLRLHGSTVAIFEEGDMLASSAPERRAELEAAVKRASIGDRGVIVDLRGGAAAIHPLTIAGKNYPILAAQSTDSITASLQVVRRVLLFGLPVLLAIAGLGGFWLTSRGLAPLGWMAAQARRITGSNLETRLDIGNAGDEVKLLAQSFNELLARLDQSFESMRRFVADASHELRTPISVIRGEADVALSRERDASEYRQSLAVILDESRRLSRLVEDLLNLARADAGRMKLYVEEFYFNDLMADCCRSIQSLAASRNIQIECRCPADVSFRGDEELLRRLLVNLLDNAIRYTPPGGRVTASLAADDAGLRVRVADTGPGIAPEIAPHVFERFFRGDKSRSRDGAGSGLGLSIVKWIAECHNGAVELESKPHSGSVFTVILPR